MERRVLFVCVRNRVRSVFAEFYLKKMLRESVGDAAEGIAVASAGLYPETLRDILDQARIPPPDPFFDTNMSPVVSQLMKTKGIPFPEGWRSKQLSPEQVSKADLVITALSWQKQEICDRYPKIAANVFTFREAAAWQDNILFETFAGLPMDDSFWFHCEEDPPYVTKVVAEVEDLMNLAFPWILQHLDIDTAANRKPKRFRSQP